MRPPPTQQLGDFELVREIGRGGMGVVFEARQVSLNRSVALKVLAGGLGLTAKAVQRFRLEAEAAAKLHHTNIVPVYATGEQDGTHFYAMELIDGPSLDHVIRQTRDGPIAGRPTAQMEDAAPTGIYVPTESTPPPSGSDSRAGPHSSAERFDRAAAMIADVADALHHAHQNGVTHRDIKPSNLLLSSDGRLSVTDFGLARMLEQPGMTVTGEFVGTPAYMSPEQITAGRIPVDHRTDVYSLGATLYHLLTLRPPFAADGRDRLLAMVIQKEPASPRSIDAKIPRDLETICLKCLEKDPDRRYQTAKDLADDLRRYGNRFAIMAKRTGLLGQAVKWSRRHPATAASLACLLVLIGVILGLGYVAYLNYKDGRERLLNEKIRSAYLVAASGDLKRTDEAIIEIEELGASTGQVHMLRGVVAYFRQDADSAIRELEQAVKLLPKSVAARSLLAIACDDIGNGTRVEQLNGELRGLSPSTPEDFLFRGFARSRQEPGEGLADIDEGLRLGNSPLGLALRALARINQAMDSGKIEQAELAITDAHAARGVVPHNQMVLFACAYSRLVAAGLYRQANRREDSDRLMKQVESDVRELEPYVGQANPMWVTWQYYDDIDDSAKALEVARRSLDRTPGPIPAAYTAVSLYRNGKFLKALECFDRLPQPDLWCQGIRCFVLAELPNDGPKQALDAYNELESKYPKAVGGELHLNDVLLVLGKKELAQASVKPYTGFSESRHWREFYQAMYDFRRGMISETTFLEKTGTSRWQQCRAHTVIGLTRLADGDRKGAREQFQKGLYTRAFWAFSWNQCEMFLARMDQDKEWPRWIKK